MTQEKTKEKLKIVTTPQDYGGVSWYRVKQFARLANKKNLAYVSEVQAKYDDRLIEEMFAKCDVFHVRFLNEHIANMVRTFKRNYPEKLVVFETDDDIHNTNPLNSAYERFGTREVRLSDGKMLWEHGKGGLDIYRNRHRMVDYEYCLEQADAIITTTMRLKSTLEKWNDNVVVIPNAIWFDYWPQLDINRKNKEEVRLVYTCSASHFEDLQMVKPAIDALLKKYPQLKFINVGQAFPYITKDIPKDRLEISPWIRCDGHGFRMACIDGDIGICPLVDNEFNANKSCLKWYEYSALGMATVASNVPPYSDEIDDGNTGLLFRTPEEMVEKVSELIEDPIKRVDIGQKAREWVKRNRNAEEIVKDWVGFMEKAAKAKKGELDVDEPKIEVLK